MTFFFPAAGGEQAIHLVIFAGEDTMK